MIDLTCLDTVRAQRPLVHCVSNLVTANDCANLALAVGASPIMAQAPEEAEAITAASAATVLNTGTPDAAKFSACHRWVQEAARFHQPLVLDPVGVGASPWRLQQVQSLLRLCAPSILRVNLGEAQALLRQDSREQGVDSPGTAGLDERIQAARAAARCHGTVVLLTGQEDVISDGEQVVLSSGGSSQMARLTGTGCMLSVLCGVFAAVVPSALDAAVLASAFWKVCSQQAEQAAGGRGPGSFHTALLDAAGTLTAQELAAGAALHEL